MNFLKTIIKKISPGVKKGIGIFISPASTIEMVEYDYDLGEIKNYTKLDFAYDAILREINIENLESVLQNILKKFDISPQTPITLTLPSIFINKKVLPMELEAEELHTALTSETEKNYIFKKSEPKVSWNVISIDKENQLNTVIYSALQKNLVDKLEEIFKRQGLKLTAIESSYPAFIRGLSVSGLVDDCLENNQNWCALIIKNNVHAAVSLKGTQILNVEESPLALNSLEADDLYPTLSSSLLEKIQDDKIDTVVIINYAKIVETNNLITYFNFKCPIIKIEDNYFNKEALFSYSLDPNHVPVNLEAIGASCWKNAPVKFGFNFLNTQGQDDVPDFLANLGVTGNPLHIVLLGLIATSLVIIALISLVLLPINISLSEGYKQLFVKCSEYEAKFAQPQTKTFNLYNVVQTGFTNNEKIITSYDSISAVIPEKVWVTSINIDENLNAEVLGRAYNVEDIISYYENLLSVAKFNNLKIKSIKVVGENSGTQSTTPDVSVNTTGTNPPPPSGVPPALPSAPGGASALPPPPPSTDSSGSIAAISGPKYYEFNFGNPSQTPPETASTTNQQKSIIPDLSNFTKDLKLGH